MTSTVNEVPRSEDRSLAVSSGSLVSRFEAIASINPNRLALVIDAQTLTYAELNERANSVAGRLSELRLPAAAVVAIWLNRSPELIVAMLGILKAGFTYLPLDATYPAARILKTMEDAAPAAMITEQSLASQLQPTDVHLLILSTEERSEINPGISVDPLQPAYVIYTSGSTGQPKGVCVSHTNVLRLLDQTQAFFNFDADDVWTMFHSPAFDFSVWEIWGALLTGAKLVLVPSETTRSTTDFYRLLSTERVTVLNQTPSAFQLLSQAEEGEITLPLALRLVILGGEALNFSTLKSWYTRHDDHRPQLVNMYGITETTVHVTLRKVTQADAHFERDILIGTPIPDLTLHLLDASLKPVSAGEIGEICVGGAGVSLGYLNRPALTAERFTTLNGERLYRSGDLARRRGDGELVYLGRRDEQVKISGFRIELGEVEAALVEHTGVAQVCVVPYTDETNRTLLAAYFTEIIGASVSIPELALKLKHQLPAQMLPAYFTRLSLLPLNSNGKVDRKGLPAPTPFFDPVGRPAKPGTEIEEAVLALVREVVGAEAIGVREFFFSADGHSLLGTQFVVRARQAFGVKLTLSDLSQAETVGEIASRIEQLILEEIVSMSEDEAHRQSSESVIEPKSRL